jgi:NAD(P)-dependent dehydrogenase (short-subunit alcohol dehydrogenase family)
MKDKLFDLEGQVAVLTGASGVLVTAMAKELALRGARVVVMARGAEALNKVCAEIRTAGGTAEAIACDVLQKDALAAAAEQIVKKFGHVDILINGAGGNKKEATTSPELNFFDIPADALKSVMDLNLLGTVFPCQVFGKIMAVQKRGVIINISSISAVRPLTRVVGYGTAKAAVNNFTQWLAVHMAQNYSPQIRVNAIAPGFFETVQNKFLLRDEKTGQLTARGQQIIGYTPAGRFGAPEDLLGALVWLCSPSAGFVTGVVVPVDGGFSAFSGV